MKLASIEPDTKFINLDVLSYVPATAAATCNNNSKGGRGGCRPAAARRV